MTIPKCLTLRKCFVALIFLLIILLITGAGCTIPIFGFNGNSTEYNIFTGQAVKKKAPCTEPAEVLP